MTTYQPFDKDPKAILDYTVRWVDWLDGDQISSSAWAADSDNPAGMVITTSTNTTGTATVWLASGTVGESYRFDNLIITTDGRQDSRKIVVRVVDK